VVDPVAGSLLGTLPGLRPVRPIGSAEVAGRTVVLTARGDMCGAYAMDTRATGSGINGYSTKRPAPDAPWSDARDYPGTVLTGRYAQVSGSGSPVFDYLTLACSERAITVKAENAPPDAPVRTAGESTRAWREGNDLIVTAGDAVPARPGAAAGAPVPGTAREPPRDGRVRFRHRGFPLRDPLTVRGRE
jgi:hypothetical protein